jgi:hypothetical protein
MQVSRDGQALVRSQAVEHSWRGHIIFLIDFVDERQALKRVHCKALVGERCKVARLILNLNIFSSLSGK